VKRPPKRCVACFALPLRKRHVCCQILRPFYSHMVRIAFNPHKCFIVIHVMTLGIICTLFCLFRPENDLVRAERHKEIWPFANSDSGNFFVSLQT
jgi:hypothetical protein